MRKSKNSWPRVWDVQFSNDDLHTNVYTKREINNNKK